MKASGHKLSFDGVVVGIILRGDGVARSGRTLSLSGPGSIFTVGSGVTLILDGITLRGMDANTASLVTVEPGGNLIMEEGTVITGNTVTGANTSSVGVGVLVEGTFTMNGGRISNNHIDIATWSGGGGVFIYTGAKFEMKYGTISGNSVGNGGGGVLSNGMFVMTDGAIYGNSSGQGGGGVSVGGEFIMEGGTISDNNAGGGGVHICGGIFSMNDGEIINSQRPPVKPGA